MPRARKGQWFLIGGIILALLLSYVAAIKGQVSVGQDTTLEPDFAFSNIKSATVSALSDIVAENTSSAHVEGGLLDWEYVLKNFAVERASNLSAFILLGVPHEGYVNATLINFFQGPMQNMTLSVGSSSVSGIDIADDTLTTFYLPEGADYFDVNMSYTLDSGFGPEIEKVDFTTTRKAFYIFRIHLTKRSGEQIMQDLVYG